MDGMGILVHVDAVHLANIPLYVTSFNFRSKTKTKMSTLKFWMVFLRRFIASSMHPVFGNSTLLAPQIRHSHPVVLMGNKLMTSQCFNKYEDCRTYVFMYMDVSEKIVGFPPKSSILIGFSITLTAHFRVALSLGFHPYGIAWKHLGSRPRRPTILWIKISKILGQWGFYLYN